VLKFLSPQNDIVFKLLFSAPQNIELLISFLTAIIKPNFQIQSAKVLNPEIPKDAAINKSIILDVVAELANGNRIDVEMQVVNQFNFRHRILYYLCRLHQSQMNVKDEYAELNPTVSIAILGYDETDEINFHTIYEMKEKTSHKTFSEDISIHLIELPKLQNFVLQNPSIKLNSDVLWSRFFNSRTINEVEELAMEQPVFKKAKTALEEIAGDPSAQELARVRDGARVNFYTAMSGARKAGIKIGMEKGMEKGIEKGMEILKKEMIQKLKLSGKSAQEISNLLAFDIEFVNEFY
jgi:predicted transposase/invertase (TIGR01784 family)